MVFVSIFLTKWMVYEIIMRRSKSNSSDFTIQCDWVNGTREVERDRERVFCIGSIWFIAQYLWNSIDFRPQTTRLSSCTWSLCIWMMLCYKWTRKKWIAPMVRIRLFFLWCNMICLHGAFSSMVIPLEWKLPKKMRTNSV